jgi:hypothetical protein
VIWRGLFVCAAGMARKTLRSSGEYLCALPRKNPILTRGIYWTPKIYIGALVQMPVFNSQMFFLGNFADMDTNESNGDTENAAAILGSYFKPPLITVAVDDIDGDGVIWDDEFGATIEDFTYDSGAGPTSQLLDSTQTYNAAVLLGDGSTSIIEITVIQMQNGDVFATDWANSGTLDNLNIQSIELLSVTGSNYSGFFADSAVDNSSVVCFTPGTLIETDQGYTPVEMIWPGHRVRTQDHGYQTIRWVGHRQLCRAELDANPHLRPIVIAKGALGNARQMRVSPQHGLLVDGQLIRAKHLAEFWGTEVAWVDRDFAAVTYIHFLCDNHEIVFADGIASESLYPGPIALKAMGRETIIEIFPELVSVLEGREAVASSYGRPARKYMTGGEIRRGRGISELFPIWMHRAG